MDNFDKIDNLKKINLLNYLKSNNKKKFTIHNIVKKQNFLFLTIFFYLCYKLNDYIKNRYI